MGAARESCSREGQMGDDAGQDVQQAKEGTELGSSIFSEIMKIREIWTKKMLIHGKES